MRVQLFDSDTLSWADALAGTKSVRIVFDNHATYDLEETSRGLRVRTIHSGLSIFPEVSNSIIIQENY